MDRTAMLTSILKVVFLLDVLASSILAAGDEVYGKRGGEIKLTPGPFSLPLVRIVWKHGDHKAIEWDDGITDAYREFKNSTFLNNATGEMRITKLDPKFNGVYSSDVNGIQATIKWKLTVLDPVSKPIIGKECNESTCKLSCKNDATVEVQCAWRNGEEELRQSDGTLKLEKADNKVGKAYICNCSNPVSFAVSDPVVPFPETPVGLIVGLLFGLPAIVIGVIALIFRKKLKEFVRNRRGTGGNSAANEDGAKDGSKMPLKGNDAAANEGGAKDASQKNGAVNQDGANETSQVPETLDNTIDDEAAPLNKNGAVNQDGANETSQENAAVNQDGANETSQDTRC